MGEEGEVEVRTRVGVEGGVRSGTGGEGMGAGVLMGVGAVLRVMVTGVVWMADAAGVAGMCVGCVEVEGEGGRGRTEVVLFSLGAPTR